MLVNTIGTLNQQARKTANEYPIVYILILNWNGWEDTIECLESVFRNDYPNYRVIVCDNDSQDGSLEWIKYWAEGRLNAYVPQDNPLRPLSFPPVSKPISYVEYDRVHAESGGMSEDHETPLILIRTGANLGFAGGNNVALRYALARNDFEYFWLLNNDTVVDPDALSFLIQRMQERPDVGMCGSTLLYYGQPDTIQALGGARYNPCLATSRHIGIHQKFVPSIDEADVESKMDYVVGASMAVSKEFLQRVGLICEDYFLYFEEIDWCTRARGILNWAYSAKSIVYHKEGNSIGSSDNGRDRCQMADYYSIINRIKFTKKYYPKYLSLVRFSFIIIAYNRVARRQYGRVIMIVKAMLSTI